MPEFRSVTAPSISPLNSGFMEIPLELKIDLSFISATLISNLKDGGLLVGHQLD
jgi:hypothetical protein